MSESTAPLSLDRLRRMVQADEIDTVVVAFTDMQGRLQGKRIHAPFFLDEVLAHGTEGCNYLLAVDVDMNTVGGYAMSSWESGYGDMQLDLDLETLRLTPWLPGTAMVQCDLAWLDGRGDVRPSPRQVLKARPANQYNVDYSVLGTTRVEPLLRAIRRGMHGAGLTVESAKGECNYGQHEIAFRYDEVVRTADQHSVYKNGAKEIAALRGKALTFMAKLDEREGNSCHIHMSLRGLDGDFVFDNGSGATEVFDQFVAGVLATLREMTLLYAPNINSYKRFALGSFAPTAVAWGRDNRTCSLRVVGHGESRRLELRLPGADVNPYLALAAMVAAGLHGLDAEL